MTDTLTAKFFGKVKEMRKLQTEYAITGHWNTKQKLIPLETEVDAMARKFEKEQENTNQMRLWG